MHLKLINLFLENFVLFFPAVARKMLRTAATCAAPINEGS